MPFLGRANFWGHLIQYLITMAAIEITVNFNQILVSFKRIRVHCVARVSGRRVVQTFTARLMLLSRDVYNIYLNFVVGVL